MRKSDLFQSRQQLTYAGAAIAKRRDQFSLIEHWRDQDALDAHAKTKHWIHFNDTVNDYLEENYAEHHYTEIPFGH